MFLWSFGNFLIFNEGSISAADILSPVRDPVKTRNRFEGLLEGAIKMYSNDIQGEVFNEINSTTGGGAATKQKENRGKSAIPSRSEILIKPTKVSFYSYHFKFLTENPAY